MAGRAATDDAEDAPRNVGAYEALIAKMATDGLVDRSRVGIIGFSYDGFYVLHALAKRPKLFAAATVADSNTYDLMQELVFFDSGAFFNQFAEVLGGKPFGDGGMKWRENSPFFSFDTIVSPLRIEAHDALSVFGQWGTYAGRRQLNKPVDLIQLPEASHDVV